MELLRSVVFVGSFVCVFVNMPVNRSRDSTARAGQLAAWRRFNDILVMIRCFAALRPLRQIRRSLPPATFQSMDSTVVTLAPSRPDHGNAVNWSALHIWHAVYSLVCRLLNVVARAHGSSDIRVSLACLHCLVSMPLPPLPETDRVYEIAVLTKLGGRRGTCEQSFPLMTRGVATGVYIGIYTPPPKRKISPSKLFMG